MVEISASFPGKLFRTALVLSLLASGCGRSDPPEGSGPPQGTPVRLQSVETDAIEASSEFVGTLDAEQSVVLRPETDGRVSEIFVASGEDVALGAPIVQLSPDQGQAQLGSATANVNAAIAQRNNAESELRALEAERGSAQADLELQNEQYRRISTLVSQGALPQERLDQIQRDRQAARAELNAIEQRIQAARDNLDRTNAALQQAQSNAELARAELDDTKVLAPIAGTIGDVPIKVGDYVTTSDTLTTITQNQALELRLSIPVERSDELRLGLPVKLSRPQSETPLGTGRISFISPQVNPDAQSILAKASFANADERLRDGQFVRAQVVWEQRPDSIVVPKTAIIFQGEQRFIYVAQEGETLTAQRQAVELGLIQGDAVEVRQGLEPGEKIVISGIQGLSDGAPIMPLNEKEKVSQQPE